MLTLLLPASPWPFLLPCTSYTITIAISIGILKQIEAERTEVLRLSSALSTLRSTLRQDAKAATDRETGLKAVLASESEVMGLANAQHSVGAFRVCISYGKALLAGRPPGEAAGVICLVFGAPKLRVFMYT